MSRKQMSSLIIGTLILLAVVIFFVVSLCLAQQHGISIVQEWQNWFGIKEAVDEVGDESINLVRLLFKI